MKQTLTIFTLGAALSAPAFAQNNEVITNNVPYLVISTAAHTTTMNAYAYAPTTPAGYDIANLATGVVAGTKKFRVMTERHNLRLAGDAHQVSGFDYVGRSAAATAATPNANAYQPLFEMFPTTARTGGGLDPNFAATPVFSMPYMAGASVGITFGMTVTTAPMALTFTDIALAQTYQGGENDDKDPNGGMGESQCTASSWSDGPTPFVTDGVWETSSGFVYNTAPAYIHWCTYLEDEGVVRGFSDWGQRRIAPLTPALEGHSLGTYYSDLATSTGPFNFGLDVLCGAAMSGNIALPLCNIGAIWNVPIPYQGEILDVNPGDAALTLLMGVPGFAGILGTNGELMVPKIPLPRLPGGGGNNIGVEYAVIDINQFALAQTTGAIWVEIN